MSSIKTHEIIILDQKPSDSQVRLMVLEYFEGEAKHYDQFNEKTEKRKLFLNKINALIAEDLKYRKSIQIVLSVACGTGFRENEIRSLSGHGFKTTGVDVSSAMCTEARKVGLEVIESEWLKADLGKRFFDAGLCLYSLGLTPSRSARLAELKKIAKHLKRGAPFYIDVMNLNDAQEWGPELRTVFDEKDLGSKGYELGDTFYRRIGADKIAYYHYFEEKEAVDLLGEAGFQVMKSYYIDCSRNYGALVGPNEGAILFMAERT